MPCDARLEIRIQGVRIPMTSTSPTPAPPIELMVRCLEELERDGPRGVAALLAEHPAEAGRLLHRLMLLGSLGLLPEPGLPPGAAATVR
jgi:hypothetical protein